MRSPTLCFVIGLLATPFLVPAISAQISSGSIACSLVSEVENSLGPEAGIVLSVAQWSSEAGEWMYEVEMSSGLRVVAATTGQITTVISTGYSSSRKQLERSATARAILSGAVPTLCTLFTEHYEKSPDSIVLAAGIEYDHGSFEGKVKYRPDLSSRSHREREWEW